MREIFRLLQVQACLAQCVRLSVSRYARAPEQWARVARARSQRAPQSTTCIGVHAIHLSHVADGISEFQHTTIRQCSAVVSWHGHTHPDILVLPITIPEPEAADNTPPPHESPGHGATGNMRHPVAPYDVAQPTHRENPCHGSTKHGRSSNDNERRLGASGKLLRNSSTNTTIIMMVRHEQRWLQVVDEA